MDSWIFFGIYEPLEFQMRYSYQLEESQLPGIVRKLQFSRLKNDILEKKECHKAKNNDGIYANSLDHTTDYK